MTDATAPDPESLRRQLQRQYHRVVGLRGRLYAQADPSADLPLQQQLAAEEASLDGLESQVSALAPPTEPGGLSTPPRGRMLGAKTTGLRVERTVHMKPLPTGVYHLLDPETDPLLTVMVANESRETRRVCVRVYIEGLSAEEVRTVEIDPRKQATFHLLPTLLPERARTITEVQRATLHVVAEDLDGKTESHDTFSIVCLARTSSFNAVRRPDTGQVVDLSHYYGAWVTPHAEAVQERVRRAADLLPNRQIWGYQDDPELVTRQVEALYRVLKEAEITYINSVIDYGAPPGQAIQRTRLPRESLAGRAANCIDGTVLFASLLEGASLNPAIVLIPGHAFVGWEAWDGSDEWRFLETTMIGSHEFEAACRSGQKQYDEAKTHGRGRLTMHKLTELRAREIYPME
ncbi:MAG: hypothetical protein ACHRXM_20200 [Isosphaerales bacterium]